jgi:hypothetical protein
LGEYRVSKFAILGRKSIGKVCNIEYQESCFRVNAHMRCSRGGGVCQAIDLTMKENSHAEVAKPQLSDPSALSCKAEA